MFLFIHERGTKDPSRSRGADRIRLRSTVEHICAGNSISQIQNSKRQIKTKCNRTLLSAGTEGNVNRFPHRGFRGKRKGRQQVRPVPKYLRLEERRDPLGGWSTSIASTRSLAQMEVKSVPGDPAEPSGKIQGRRETAKFCG